MYTEQNILKRFRKLRMGRFATALCTSKTCEEFDFLSFEGKLLYLLDSAESQKRNKQADDLRKETDLPYPSCELADFDLSKQPYFSKYELEPMLDSGWIHLKQDQVFTGEQGSEKLKLACAIANSTIDQGISVKAVSLSKLMLQLRVAFSRTQLTGRLSELSQIGMLLIYDWQLEHLPLPDIPLIAKLLSVRKGPLLIVTNLLVEKWFDDLSASQIPEAIKARLLCRAHTWFVKEPIKETIH